MSGGDSILPIQKFLVELCKRDWSVTTVDGLDYRFVIITESFEDDIGEIFSIEWAAKERKGVGLCFDQLHVGIDVLVAFNTRLELLFELLDMAPSRFTIRSG